LFEGSGGATIPALEPMPQGSEQRTEPRSPRSRREEIAELYTRYGAQVSRRCAYLLRDPEAAKDATQEVFVKVMRSIETFRAESSPLTWILTITTNHCLNQIAAQKAPWHERYKRFFLHQAETVEIDAGDPLERAQLIRRLLSKLDAETQQVAIHYYVDEMTQEEIGQALGRSLPTVRKRLQKFQRVAKKEFGHELA
jgi:RNA polymerase sigma-70 factor (ECF subfamily)